MPKVQLLTILGLGLVFASAASCTMASRLEVLLLTERFPGTDCVFVEALRASLAAEGFAVRPVDAGSVARELGQRTGRRRILVLTNAACFPADAVPALLDYLAAGGNLLTIGGPPFSRQVVQVDGEWLTRQTLLDKLATMPPVETILDFGRVDLSRAVRDTGTPKTKPTVRVAAPGFDTAQSALEVSVPSVELWEFQNIPVDKSFAGGETVTTFWAKGSANARRLTVAWVDSDDARWNARIDLTTSWKRYVLTAGMFAHWRGPGGPEDRLDPRKVVMFKVGFENHNLRNPKRPASFWITDIRSMPNPAGDADFTQPTIETLSPAYKTYTTRAAAYVPTFGSYEDVAAAPAIAGEAHTVCSLPRYRGLGFNKTAPHRWIPVLCVRKPDGGIGGAAAALYVQDNKRYGGSVWATFGLEDPDFLESHRADVAREVISLVKRIDDGLYLLSGGVDRASYSEETPAVGAVVLNLGERTEAVDIECTINPDPEYQDPKSATHPGVVFESKRTFELDGKRTICELGSVEGLSPGFYVANVSMYRDGELVDAIRQPFSIVEDSKPVPESELVTIEGDQFYYHGKPWFSLGINYRPVYVASMERGPFWQHWCHPDQYDAEIIEMELSLMNRIGLNTVSLIYADVERIPPAFVDFMERAHRHGIKCHVFLAGLHPLRPAPRRARSLIRAARLWERPAMFAYDVAWEVRVGREKQRQGADAHWRRWLEDRYGSVENAEKDWDFALRKDVDGRVHGPTDGQISEEGPWNRMVAAYRRFWDDRISRGYMNVARIVDKIDPYHPISARSGFNGTGSLFAVPQFPFDLLSGAKHLDYISPEGYNFTGDRQSFREGGFTTLYGKFASGGKPIYWAELGCSVSGNPTPERLERQREYYEKIYKVFYETRSAGSAAWWWPGYLIWEKSDFSIINPDFTPRPGAREFTRMAEIAAKPYALREPDYWIEIDRDLYANGYAGLLQDKRQEYGKAVSEGKAVGLRTKGTGTDSASFPRIAVGNTPLNGKNPPKFLNGEFNSLEIRNAKGRWVMLEDGGRVEVEAAAPVYARASLGNIAESKWLAPKANRDGGVYLEAAVDDTSMLAPIADDTPFLSDAEVSVFRLTEGVGQETKAAFQLITGDIRFGEKRYITLVAVG